MQPPLPSPRPATDVLHDAGWPGEARAALLCSGLLLGIALVVDAGTPHGLTLPGALGCITLGMVLLVILLPARVSAAPGLLTVRGLWVTRTVRTDRLVAIAWPADTAGRLALRDEDNARAEVDLRVLLANPALWLRIEADALTSRAHGTLEHGTADLTRLALHVHSETARTVLRVSGLD
ncbi:hypothetical protein SNE510_42520 [Streptomyces sp. NE5-10]|uniref:hypothetical protein n=1 Tax=Streptomyces sp. NE5-10 TaxID=2759674 RepID=UPI001907F912|nr:hypothetical protein [Streptomyces sp. NE5-10]GHJ94733.1 hypothetical protein SNE510_42520 [Streptomyces sp. NE5-10]